MLDCPEDFEESGDKGAVLDIVRGQWTEAEVLAERARSVVRRGRLEEYVTSVLLYAIAARSAIHRGELDRARENLSRVQRLRAQVGVALPVYAAQTRLEMVRAHIALTDLPTARTLLGEVDGLLRDRPGLDVIGQEARELRTQLDAMERQDALPAGLSCELGDVPPSGSPSP